METRAKHFIDLTGQTFGQLTVLQLDKVAKPKGIAYWACRCDCGKTVSVSRNHLRSGHTKSCGHTHELKDLTGQIFGKLKVLMYDEYRPYPWVCRCDCGQFISVSGGALRDGRQRSCGCLKTIKDIRGQRFGRLIALRVRVRVYWECKCDCGQPTTVLGESLRLGLTKSCGCINSERVTKGLRTTHGHNPRRSRSPEYSVWAGMIYRCTNKNALNYSKYGGRGIKVCERWTSFENFLADVGPRPSLAILLIALITMEFTNRAIADGLQIQSNSETHRETDILLLIVKRLLWPNGRRKLVLIAVLSLHDWISITGI